MNSFEYGYCLEINTVEDLIESANCKLFKNSQNQHSTALPPPSPTSN